MSPSVYYIPEFLMCKGKGVKRKVRKDPRTKVFSVSSSIPLVTISIIREREREREREKEREKVKVLSNLNLSNFIKFYFKYIVSRVVKIEAE